jgi:transposase
MTRLAIHHQAALARGHAEIAAAISQQQLMEPVSVRSVRRILNEPVPGLAELNGVSITQRPGRPSVAEAFRHQVATLLEEEPQLSTAEIFRRAREFWCYSGAKSAFYVLVKSVRKPLGEGVEPIVRFEGLPGEYAQFDFGERWVTYISGVKRKVIVFVGRLKYSRHVHVVVVPDQRAETLVRAVVSSLAAWACVPLIWVFDNPKTVRISRIGQPIEIHSYLASLAAELNAAVLLCTPYQPQQKGSVERGVGWFKNGFLAQRRFVDDEDIQFQLKFWLFEINSKRVSDATGIIPAIRLIKEQSTLAHRLLPFTVEKFALRIPVTVLPTGVIHVNGTSYSVDPKKVGAPAIVYFRQNEVEIVINSKSCTHHRIDYCDIPQRLPEHRREMLSAVYGERKRNSFKRQCLWEIGNEAQDFLEGLIHHCGPNATGWYRPIHQLFALLEEHGDNALRDAMSKVNNIKQYNVASIVRALRPTIIAEVTP